MIEFPKKLKELLFYMNRRGARPLLVGGAVRDHLLGMPPKDLDFEVHNTSPEVLLGLLHEACASSPSTHKVEEVGRSFGVIKLTVDGEAYDFALPRTETKTSSGHRGFAVSVDPSLSVARAALRRDFTINGIYYDPSSGQVIDPHGGVRDLENRVLRHISPAFEEDPLRVLRAVQFAARFSMSLAPETADLCFRIKDRYHELSQERVRDEVSKFLLKGQNHQLGMEAWSRTGWLAHAPELSALEGLPQDPQWHPEGDVLTHTALSLTALGRMDDFVALPPSEKLVYGLAVLCHDLGKATTTRLEPSSKNSRHAGRITARGHEAEGVAPATTLLSRWGFGPQVIQRVSLLVKHHMAHVNRPNRSSVLRLAAALSPSAPHRPGAPVTETIAGLALVVEADHAGRPPLPPRLPSSMTQIVETARSLGCLHSPPPPLFTGHQAISLGIPQGKSMSAFIKAVYQQQLQSGWSTPAEAEGWAAKNLHTMLPKLGGPAPALTSSDLKKLGIPPGPCYRQMISSAYRKQLSHSPRPTTPSQPSK